MGENREVMRLMIIEDDDNERKRFLDYAKKIPDKIKFVCSTNSSTRGLEVMRDRRPQGVILDLELHLGEGKGMAFLQGLINGHPDGGTYVDNKPIIVVITNTQSSVVYNVVRNLGVDLIWYKQQKGYSAESVIDDMLMFYNNQNANIVVDDVSELSSRAKSEKKDSPRSNVVIEDDLDDDRTNSYTSSNSVVVNEKFYIPDEVSDKIDFEFDNLGMGRGSKGRIYLKNAVEMFVVIGDDADENIITRVANSHNVERSTVTRSMSLAIEKTWEEGDEEVLKQSYSVRLGTKKNNPTYMEFIYYYSDKVRKKI